MSEDLLVSGIMGREGWAEKAAFEQIRRGSSEDAGEERST